MGLAGFNRRRRELAEQQQAPLPDSEQNLDDLTVPELQTMASDLGLENTSSMRKQELIDAIKKAQ